MPNARIDPHEKMADVVLPADPPDTEMIPEPIEAAPGANLPPHVSTDVPPPVSTGPPSGKQLWGKAKRKMIMVPDSPAAGSSAEAVATPTSTTSSSRLSIRAFAHFLFRKKKAAVVEGQKFTIEVPLQGFEPSRVAVTLDIDAPHTLSWEVDIRETDKLTEVNDVGDEEAALPKGTCLLYTYPKVRQVRHREIEPTGAAPSKAGLRALSQILRRFAEETNAFSCCDGVGAFPIHALVVCNTPASLELSMDIYREYPQLLLQTHAPSGPFSGESSLHILAANKQEALLLELVNLATEQLGLAEVEQLLTVHTEGVFFTGLPMRFYGSTVLGFACSFGLRDAVRALLGTGHVDLNRRESACKVTGMLPIHAVVANSDEDMYDFLTEQLPRKWRADPLQQTRVGHHAGSLELAGVSAMQLGATLGDRALVRHILRKQCDIMWVWGPVTQFALNLTGIDSTGTGGGDVMELIVKTKARRRTQEFLLDSFMNGFIYQLYQEKWKLFGRKIHFIRRAIDFLLIISLATQTFIVKSNPALLLDVKPLAIINIIIMAFVTEEEARTTYLLISESKGEGDVQFPLKAQAQMAYEFLMQHNMHVQFIAYVLAFIGSSLILAEGVLPSVSEFRATDDWFQGYMNISEGEEMYGDYKVVDEGSWASLWLVQAFALLFLVLHLATVVFDPFDSLSILLNTIAQMVRNDLSVYMAVFLWLFTAFYMALYILYPRSGSNALPFAPSLNRADLAGLDLIRLSFLGEGLDVFPLWDAAMAISGPQAIAFFAWIVLYYVWLILAVILMLNLLIAMLTNTFDDVFDEATLQSRLSFAVGVMKLEIIARSFNIGTAVGESGKGGRVYLFRSVERRDGGVQTEDSYELGAEEGGSNPFNAPMPSETDRLSDYVASRFAALEEKIDALKTETAKGVIAPDSTRGSPGPADALPEIPEWDAAPGGNRSHP